MADEPDDTEAARQADARLAERSAAILPWTSLATRPLFVANDLGDPVHIGSSILLRIGDACFAVTAGHVLDSAPPAVELYVGTPSAMPAIPGERSYTVPNFGGRALDQVDVGFVRISPAAVQRMTDCLFLTSDQIDVNDLADYTPVFGTKYLAMGYPHELVEFGATGTRYKADVVPWVGNPRTLAAFPSFRLYESSHVMLEFDGDHVAKQMGRPRRLDPTGMSGGGLFRFGTLPRASTVDDRLVGVLIEKHLESHGTILATRLAFVTEGIRAKYPEFSEHIPVPRNIKIQITERAARPTQRSERAF